MVSKGSEPDVAPGSPTLRVQAPPETESSFEATTGFDSPSGPMSATNLPRQETETNKPRQTWLRRMSSKLKKPREDTLAAIVPAQRRSSQLSQSSTGSADTATGGSMGAGRRRTSMRLAMANEFKAEKPKKGLNRRITSMFSKAKDVVVKTTHLLSTADIGEDDADMEETPVYKNDDFAVHDSPLTLIASLLPTHLVGMYITQDEPKIEPLCEKRWGVLMFADISGFTKLAETLAETRGKAGSEDLMAIINHYLGRIISSITDHGGDVLKFAGDATLAVWLCDENDEVSKEEAMLNACKCSMEMHGFVVDDYGDIEVNLSLHIGVGAGEVCFMHVGGLLDRWEMLVLGEAVGQFSEAEGQAPSGDTVLSPEAWEFANHACEGSVLETGYVKLLDADASVQPITLPEYTSELELRTGDVNLEVLLGAYAPRAIVSRARKQQTGLFTELRVVTVLFISLPDIHFADVHNLDLVQSAMIAIQSSLYKYEGSVNKFLSDDKGTVLIAVFGLPPLSHDNDAVRSISAALLIRSELTKIGMKSQIGITTGGVYCGVVGNARRCEYTIMGDAVNLSARLMQMSKDEVLCAESTHNLASSSFSFDTLEPIMVKGKAQPVAVFRPTAALSVANAKTRRNRRHSALFGRDSAKQLILSAIKSLEEGTFGGKAILIEGEGGMGKSAILDETVFKDLGESVAVLSTVCSSLEQSTLYFPIRFIFETLLNLKEVDQDTGRERVIELFNSFPGMESYAPLCNPVLPFDVPENDLTKEMTGEVRADNTVEAMLAAIGKFVREKPTLLVIEDCHSMDTASWRLVQMLYRALKSSTMFSLVLTYRPNEQLKVLAKDILKDGEHIKLAPLQPTDTVSLVCDCLSVKSLEENTSKLILDRAQGNPFFTVELALFLLDRGMVEKRGQEGLINRNADISSIAFPDTLQGMITQRIDRLTDSQQSVLKYASIIGQTFDSKTLAHLVVGKGRQGGAQRKSVLPGDPLQMVQEALQELQVSDFVVALGNQEKHSFVQPIIQETAYSIMLFSQRRELHQAVAEYIESVAAGEDLEQLTTVLAFHWARAEIPKKSIFYLKKAAEQALQGFANQEAANFLNKALEVSGSSLRRTHVRTRAEIQLLLGEAYLGLGDLEQSQKYLESALRSFGKPIPASAAGLCCANCGQLMVQVCHACVPGNCRGLRKKASKQDAIAKAHSSLSEIYYYKTSKGLAFHCVVKALNVAETGAPSAIMAKSYANASLAAANIPIGWLAKVYGRKAQKVAESLSTGSMASMAWVLLLNGAYFAGVGECREALEALRRAADMSTQIGDKRSWESAMAQVGAVLFHMGSFGESVDVFEKVISSAKKRHDNQIVGRAQSGIAASLLIIADFDAALPYVGNSSKVSVNQAIYLLLQERYDEALAVNIKCYGKLADSRRAKWYLLKTYMAVVDVFLALWERGYGDSDADDKTIAERSRQSIEAMTNFCNVFTIGRPRLLIAEGLEQWLLGNANRAHSKWQLALETAQKMELSYDEAKAHFEIGRHSGDAGRQKHLTCAIEMFHRCNATVDKAAAEIAIATNSVPGAVVVSNRRTSKTGVGPTPPQAADDPAPAVSSTPQGVSRRGDVDAEHNANGDGNGGSESVGAAAAEPQEEHQHPYGGRQTIEESRATPVTENLPTLTKKTLPPLPQATLT